MLARLLLAAALFAPQAAGALHTFEVARAELDHPVCSASGSEHLDPGSAHEHHNESHCLQCSRPPSAATAPADGGTETASPSFIGPFRASTLLLQPLLLPDTRGPPAV